MEFRILGPLEVVEEGRVLPLGGGKERALLALLLLHARQVVSTDVLVDELWAGDPPATAGKSVQVYVSRLRKMLGEGTIVTRTPGYALEIEPDELDSECFERLLGEARGKPPVEASAALRDALALWRGPPLSDVAYESFARADIARLEELRLAAIEDRIDADLRLGRHAQLVGELQGLVQRHPLRERLRGQLMLALYRSGRQAEALDVYRDTRTTLSQELGLEPGEELKELERRMLAQDPALAVPAEVTIAAHELARSRRRLVVGTLAGLAVAGAAASILALTLGGETAPVVAKANSVAVIDPGSDRVVGAVSVDPRPTRIAVHGDDLWILHPDGRILSHLNRRERALIGTVGLGGAPSGLAADARGAWVSDARTGALTLIKAERLVAARRIETRTRSLVGPYSDAGNVGIGFGSLWLASGGSTIARVDPRTGKVVARIRGVATGESLGGIAFGAGSVWVAGPFQESPVVRIDRRRNAVVATITVPKFRSNGIATTRDGVWISDAGSDQIWRIDPSRNVPVSATQVGAAPLGIAAGAGSLWVANSGDGTVSRIDPASGRIVRTIAVGGSPNSIAVADDEIWVTVD